MIGTTSRSTPASRGLIRRSLVAGLVAVGLLAAPAVADAAPPGNDNFANAIGLPAGLTTTSGDNTEATKETGEPDHAADLGGASVWWTWTPAVTARYEISTCGSSVDTVLAVYTGPAVDQLQEVASNNDDATGACASGSRVSAFLTAGQTYRIAVDGAAGAVGPISLAITGSSSPAHDDFAFAIPLTGAYVERLDQSNEGMTKELDEPDHAFVPGGASAWYRWTAAASGLTTVDTCGSDFDALLGVYTGNTVDALNEVPSDVFDCLLGLGSFVEFTAQRGQVYRIAVDGLGGQTGRFDLYIEGEAVPPLPQCSDRADNDGDGRVDLADPGCTSAGDSDERNPPPPPPPANNDKPGGGSTKVAATSGNDRLTGTAAGETICGLGGSDVISGLGGNDNLFGDQCGGQASVALAAATDGNDRLDGGEGNDRLSGSGGNDRLKGGAGKDSLNGDAGKDKLAGGSGKDKLNGGKGRDSLSGGSGNDSLNARDGARDSVDCGKGKDKAKADRLDRVRGCEKVQRPTRR